MTFALPVYDHTVSPVTPVIQTRLNWSVVVFQRTVSSADQCKRWISKTTNIKTFVSGCSGSRRPVGQSMYCPTPTAPFRHEHQHCMNATRNPMDRQVWNFLLKPNIAQCDSSSHQCRGTFAMHSSDKKRVVTKVCVKRDDTSRQITSPRAHRFEAAAVSMRRTPSQLESYRPSRCETSPRFKKKNTSTEMLSLHLVAEESVQQFGEEGVVTEVFVVGKMTLPVKGMVKYTTEGPKIWSRRKLNDATLSQFESYRPSRCETSLRSQNAATEMLSLHLVCRGICAIVQ